jgi:hypothetical protein
MIAGGSMRFLMLNSCFRMVVEAEWGKAPSTNLQAPEKLQTSSSQSADFLHSETNADGKGTEEF